jgi:hypothetical protein
MSTYSIKGEKFIVFFFFSSHFTLINYIICFFISFEAYTGGQYWIDGSNLGAADYYASDAWRFSDNTVMPMDYNFWSPGMPDYAGYHHCVRITTSLKFNDYSCDHSFLYICEQWCRWSAKMKVPFWGLPIYHFNYPADPRLFKMTFK